MSLRFALFYHSLLSDWNHGNAHFLRGVVAELQSRGHDVSVYEPENGWSLQNLRQDCGDAAVQAFQHEFPHLKSTSYTPEDFNVEAALDGVDVAIVHEWSDPALVAAIGKVRQNSPRLRLFFHDTHHRAITAPDEIARFDLSNYDGILAYGESLAQAYRRLGWGRDVHVWHESADARIFYPRTASEKTGDIVWIGNWGDDERTRELQEFLINPIRDLKLSAQIYGVRYPKDALASLDRAGISYRGWLPNYEAPRTFAKFRATVHVPRRPYVEQLAGIPTIRPFEALACGIPLISAPWRDTEGLFRVGTDFLMVNNEREMKQALHDVLNDSALADSLVKHGLETIRARHTCEHRVTELLNIYGAVAPVAEELTVA